MKNKRIAAGVEPERDHGQGVFSAIQFPLGQDEIAVSMAICQLLAEGWRFRELDKSNLTLVREWRV